MKKLSSKISCYSPFKNLVKLYENDEVGEHGAENTNHVLSPHSKEAHSCRPVHLTHNKSIRRESFIRFHKKYELLLENFHTCLIISHMEINWLTITALQW